MALHTFEPGYRSTSTIQRSTGVSQAQVAEDAAQNSSQGRIVIVSGFSRLNSYLVRELNPGLDVRTDFFSRGKNFAQAAAHFRMDPRPVDLCVDLGYVQNRNSILREESDFSKNPELLFSAAMLDDLVPSGTPRIDFSDASKYSVFSAYIDSLVVEGRYVSNERCERTLATAVLHEVSPYYPGKN